MISSSLFERGSKKEKRARLFIELDYNIARLGDILKAQHEIQQIELARGHARTPENVVDDQDDPRG